MVVAMNDPYLLQWGIFTRARSVRQVYSSFLQVGPTRVT